jgi:hypothetical protein
VNASLAPWPVCPPPYDGESLHSWFERVSAFYGLPAHRMLSSVARGLLKPRRRPDAFKVGTTLAGNRKVARRLISLSGLSPSKFSTLRPPRTGWELPRLEFRAYCPRCCLDDLHRGETPYGRLVWQQAWYTVCRVHRIPLLLRRSSSVASWKTHQLQQDSSLAAALGYQHAKQVQRERFYIQYALLEIQEAIEQALGGVRPRRRQWGVVSARSFLHVLKDLTTWSLTHFETVRSWSLAEDLTAIEIADGFKLIGRHRRMTLADYAGDRTARRLVDVDDPAVRGSALWFAHSVTASFHQDVSDRQTAYRRTSRQELKYAASSPAARAWLATQVSNWPERYRSKYWLNPQP